MALVKSFLDVLERFMAGNFLYVLSGLGWVVYVLCLEKKERQKAIIVALFLGLGIFNPISYRILAGKLGYEITATYYRLLWMFPFHIALAYAIYVIIYQLKNAKSRLVLVVAICITVLWLNVDAKDLQLPDNAYQIPIETIEVAEQLSVLRNTKGDEYITILPDTRISNTIRQYDAHICLPFSVFGTMSLSANLNEETILGFLSMLTYNRNDIPKEAIEKLVIENEIDYLVIHAANDVSLAYMQEMGWQVISVTSAYYILDR